MSEKSKTIFRTVKNQENPFVMMDRRPIENPELSWRAKGVLAYLLSRPDNWTVRIGDLVKRSTDGVHSIRNAIRELEKAGHIQRIEVRDPKTKRFVEYTLEVYELPFRTKPLTKKPLAEKPQAVNRTLNDTDVNDTDSKDIGAHAPLEWKIAHGEEITDEDLRFSENAKRIDSANLVAMGLGAANQGQGYALAMAFMEARNITIPASKAKGQRKALREMIVMHVRPEHIKAAVEKLMADGLTVVDLFSVSKTAEALANMTPEAAGYNPQGLEVGL